MRYYAIRQKGTEKFMPLVATGRGNTHAEPQLWSYGPIRLFTSAAGASRALARWVQGRIVREIHYSVDFFGPDEREQLVVQPVEGRSKDAMEIVEVEIRVIE